MHSIIFMLFKIRIAQLSKRKHPVCASGHCEKKRFEHFVEDSGRERKKKQKLDRNRERERQRDVEKEKK